MQNNFETKKCLAYVANILNNSRYVQNNLKDICSWILDEAEENCNFPLLPGQKDISEKDFMDFAKKHKRKALLRIKEFAAELRKKTIISPRTKRSILEENLCHLQTLFNLKEEEKELLGFIIRVTCDPDFQNILHSLRCRCSDLTIEENAAAAGINPLKIFELCSANAPLLKLGLLEYNYDGSLDTTQFSKFFYLHKFLSTDAIKRHILGRNLQPNLNWEDFSHISQIDTLKKLLLAALKTREKGVNILLYGEPGTGKTEFSKTLAQNINAALYSIGENENTIIEEDEESRYQQIIRVQMLLKSQKNCCLLVDEADDILSSCCGLSFFYHKRDKKVSKIKVNRLLENNLQPTIWILNDISSLDKAYLRRFTFALNFTKPDKQVVCKMWQKSLKENNLPHDQETAEKFATKYSLSPSFINTAAKSVGMIKGGLQEVDDILNILQTAYNNGEAPKTDIIKPATPYNPHLLNTDTNLEYLADRIAHLNKRNFSLCLYGASGTGKSAYAQHLGERLHLPVIKKRCSDILSKYVGEAEQNIATAFAEAEQKGALLIFDEADSFLQDRTDATKSWEITQVNEMLTQMEKHPLPFICTTNLMDKLDKAALRRFTFKVKYDYMTDTQKTLCFEHFFGIKNIDLSHLPTLTPGDFVVVKHKAEILDCLRNAEKLIELLEEEQKKQSPHQQKNRVSLENIYLKQASLNANFQENPTMAYDKTYDLLDLAVWMQSTREGVSLNDIAERFHVSRRTAERMRDMIISRFVQTVETTGENNIKRWHIPQGTLKDFIQFSAEELSVLELAADLFKQKHLSDKQAVYQKIIEKIKANIKHDTFRKIEPDAEALLEAEGFICRPGPKLKIDPQIISSVRLAILECHRIKITYFNKKTGKTSVNILDPYGFLYGERNHYLVAHHSDGYFGDAVHNFILSNIKHIEILDEPFQTNPDFNLQEYAKQSFGAYHEEPFAVEWLFDAEVSAEAEMYEFHPTQTMTKNKDGTLTVKFTAGGRKEMDWHLYTWGNHVRVIKPTDWSK